MTSPAAELQKAIFAALTGDPALTGALGGAKVFDRAPTGTPFPYVTFGRTSLYDWSTGTESGTEQLVTLHVWTRSKGKAQAQEIMDRVATLLDGAELPLDGHALVNLRQEFSETRYDDDLELEHGLLRFRAVTERTG